MRTNTFSRKSVEVAFAVLLLGWPSIAYVGPLSLLEDELSSVARLVTNGLAVWMVRVNVSDPGEWKPGLVVCPAPAWPRVALIESGLSEVGLI
jgi:hypothetical protein